MIPFVDALERIERVLGGEGFRFALIGGAAIVARVRPRFTQDLDLLVSMDAGDLDRLLAAATREGYVYDPMDRSLFEEGLIHLAVEPGGVSVDLIRADSTYLERVVTRAQPLDGLLARVPVATVEDLVLLKLEAGRPIDIDDILAIKDASASSLDRAYLAEQAKILGLELDVAMTAPPSRRRKDSVTLRRSVASVFSDTFWVCRQRIVNPARTGREQR